MRSNSCKVALECSDLVRCGSQQVKSLPFVCEATSRSFHGIALDRLRWDRHAGLVGEFCNRLAIYNNSLRDKIIYGESGEERT